MEWIKYSLVYTADSEEPLWPIRFENSIRNRIGRPIRFEIRFERKKKNDSHVPTSIDCLEHKGDMSSFHNFTGDAKETFELVL